MCFALFCTAVFSVRNGHNFFSRVGVRRGVDFEARWGHPRLTPQCMVNTSSEQIFTQRHVWNCAGAREGLDSLELSSLLAHHPSPPLEWFPY